MYTVSKNNKANHKTDKKCPPSSFDAEKGQNVVYVCVVYHIDLQCNYFVDHVNLSQIIFLKNLR